MKKNNRFEQYENVVLTKEEQEISDSIAEGGWISILTPARRKELQKMAQEYNRANKDKSVTFRVKTLDLELFKEKAEEASVPYQTLLGTLIRQYVQGKIVVKL